MTLVRCAASCVRHYTRSEQSGRAVVQQLFSEVYHEFTGQPVLTEVALQVLASRCVLLHRELQVVQRRRLHHQQQLLPLSQQLGKRMRGNKLLLSDPRQCLAELLPGDAFVAADAAYLQLTSSGGSSAVLRLGAGELYAMLGMLFSTSTMLCKPGTTSSTVASQLALFGQALPMIAELLLLSAVHWQQLYYSLTEQQQRLLTTRTAELAPEDEAQAEQIRDAQLTAAEDVAFQCVRLLQQQMRQLWVSGQGQQVVQLLQHSSGEVLLQGLTLVVQIASLDVQLIPDLESLTLADLLSILDDLDPGTSYKTTPCCICNAAQPVDANSSVLQLCTHSEFALFLCSCCNPCSICWAAPFSLLVYCRYVIMKTLRS
jgi:hypothetical protein